MTKIKLNDRVKHVDGRIGTVVYDDGGSLPLFVFWDTGEYGWRRRDDPRIAEVIGHRYFVDTPFEIGETYETDDGSEETVVGLGLICRDQNGRTSFREAGGVHPFYSLCNLILPSAKPEPKPYKEIVMEGVRFQLVPVESEE